MKPLSLYMVAAMTLICSIAADGRNRTRITETDTAFFHTAEAARIGRQVIAYQRCTGGWPKNIDMTRPLADDELRAVIADKGRRNDSTTDNDATTTQMAYLARLYHATADTTWAAAVRRGAEYLLSGQYDNGGWPQFWPVQRDYQGHITYNDDAMAHTMTVIRDLRDGVAPYDTQGLIDDTLRARLDTAFNRGIDCILATQIVVDGEPTVWCQQHDRTTLQPAGARAYELPSFVSSESATLVWMLMELPDPDERVRRAIEGAMRWFDRTRIDGMRYERRAPGGATLVPDPDACTWARYYDLDQCLPFVCDRDGVPRRSLDEIGTERRNGYAWYTGWPVVLFDKYDQWRLTHGL